MSARKDFRYALELEGANQFLIQEITPPTVELPELLHGAPGNLPDVKTPGKMKVGDLVLKQVKPEATADTWIWEWIAQGIAGLEPTYKRLGYLTHLAPDALTSIEKYYVGECWAKKIEPGGFKSQGDGANLIDTITLSVRFYFPTTSPQFLALFGGSAARAAGLGGTLGKNI